MTTTAAPAARLTHGQIMVIYGALMLGMIVGGMSQMVVGTALPTIVGELGGLKQLSWVITITVLSSTCATPIFGKLGDLYGRKLLFQAALVLFIVSSIAAGAAQSMGQLIVFRAAQGVGSGGLFAVSQGIIADVVPPRARGRYQGYMTSVWACVSVAGPLVGGFFVDHVSWRWCFYGLVPLAVVALVVVQRVLQLPYRREAAKIDYWGSAFLVLAVSSLLLLTTRGGNGEPWASAATVRLAVLALVGLVLFVLRERRAPDPVLPLRLFRDRTFALTGAIGFLQGVSLFGLATFMPVFLQVVVGMSATTSGLQLAPMMAGMMVTSTWSGRRISRTGRYRVYPIAGSAIMLVAAVMLAGLGTGASTIDAFAPMVVMGVGLGLVMHVVVLAVQNAVDPSDVGVATASSFFFRQMGGAVGTALFGTVFSSTLTDRLAHLSTGPNALDVRALTGAPAEIRSLPVDIRADVIAAFGDALHLVFLYAVPVAVLGFVLAWFVKEHPLRDWDDADGEAEESDAYVAGATARFDSSSGAETAPLLLSEAVTDRRPTPAGAPTSREGPRSRG